MDQRRKRKQDDYLSRFKLDEDLISPGNAAKGQPEVVGGDDPATGQRVLIKIWRRDPSTDDTELRDIWRQEVRQLHRLAGYPGARDCIAMLRDTAEDRNGFYLIISPGQRTLLETYLRSGRSSPSLAHPRPERNRLLIWQNLRRVANGLAILHAQGLLHRNLDAGSILTAGTDEADFLLSGFEWSIRLTSDVGWQSARTSDTRDPVIYSFLQDWHAFGALAATLVGSTAASFTNAGTQEDVDHLIGAEKELIRLALRGDPLRRLDGELVLERIDGILTSLSSVVARRNAPLYLACALGAGSAVSKAIRSVDETIELQDVDRQLSFIRADLADEPLLLAMADEASSDGRRYVLAGSNLTYRLSPLRPQGREPTWEVAHCDDYARQRPAASAILAQAQLGGTPIEVLTPYEARNRLPMLLGKAQRWDRRCAQSAGTADDDLSRQHRAFVLLQLLEALLIAAAIWPVTVISSKRGNDGRNVIGLKPRRDEEREKLSSALGMKSPAARMREAFSTDQAEIDQDWKLAESGFLGDRDENPRWRFVDIEGEDGAEPIFMFEGTWSPPIGDELFLRIGDHAGQDALLRRRIKALRALRDHEELLEMLADPRSGIRQTHDTIAFDAAFNALDRSKQEALREIWAVLPGYFLQGPPGVGKTRLIRELVARCFGEDRTSRLLLTAQSHPAVNHVLDEVAKVLGEQDSNSAFGIRCHPKDHDGAPGKFDLRVQAQAIAQRLSRSALAGDAPAGIKQGLTALEASLKDESGEDDEQPRYQHRLDRAFEALLLRSANVVFASSNAGDLERLIEERAQFDWTIIEEAGKATGVELVAPLLLSHRRLMIGDHKQLPPFGADELKKLLEDPAKIHSALECGRPLISRPFRQGAMEGVIDDIGTGDELASACGEAARALMLFEAIVETELRGTRTPSTRLPIARRLTKQHRMHPAIARVVSTAFYDDTLETDDECKRRYSSEPLPYSTVDSVRLPLSPIVFIDMPFVQSTKGHDAVEHKPRYHNPDEVDAVLRVLSLLRPVAGNQRPSLGVLSPYRQQAKRLRQRIAEERSRKLGHLSGFDTASGIDDFVGTVDSFQGNEADAVVISLVRNNHHAGARGLGFLSDARRMNVLVSRAKWKLILVGSLEFLESRFPKGSVVSKSDPLSFLRLTLDALRVMQSERDHGVPLCSVVPYARLRGE